ncbi:MAG: Holliday junction branch migration protein RuvA [Moraxellaceae bacterium]|jgi:Holliday junction DNA helicase RuvA|nr:Holliday junction branch migration protein RuvA [Moraxellaceae bacterium]MBK7301614.1 Holliday junction branch migration protein RuvA [Moraxellaceae bacterium]MBK8326379.1 Holliday junction branch migration protein RuvA [Moraxellaceae bacterium]MBK9185805.1 Holliday junction branch migration protein RuvA [Moraxellaceae bacterium]MBL0230476.1 Holliday junction branch migration protein RuvA [Moraxellaceae bacterium]
MIGRLKGIIVDKHAPQIIIDINGLGYEVETPLSTFCRLRLGETEVLWTHLVVREDAQLLYGFSEKEERALFRLLLKVSGIGPKVALALLSGMETNAFLRCIESEDISTLTKIPGVGKKTAERLMIELRDRIKELMPHSATPNERLTLTSPLSPVAEAEQALMALGYKPLEAQKAVALVKSQHEDTAGLIRAALKAMIK